MPNRVQLGREQAAIGLPWRLFLFSLLVVIAVVVIYAGLDFGYKIYLNNQIKVRDQKINELTQAISQEEQNQFINFYSQLANLQILLDKHLLISKIFPFLEKNTNQQVYYNRVDLRASQRRLDLEGAAASYEIFAQQLEALNRAPEVEQLVVNDSQASGGRVTFRLFIILKTDTFK